MAHAGAPNLQRSTEVLTSTTFGNVNVTLRLDYMFLRGKHSAKKV